MKKFLSFISTALIITILLVGCNYKFDNINFNEKKPNNFYYTNLLAKNLTLETPVKSIITETNFHKDKELSKENVTTIRDMIKSLNGKNFIDKPKDLPEKPIYKLAFTFSKEKLVINIYNEKYLSVHPWDGDYPMDYIDMTGLPMSLNLYSLGRYIYN